MGGGWLSTLSDACVLCPSAIVRQSDAVPRQGGTGRACSVARSSPTRPEGRCAARFRAERGSARRVHITRDDIDNLKQRIEDSESRLRSGQADWGPDHCRVAAATTTLPSKRRNEPSSEEMSDCCI